MKFLICSPCNLDAGSDHGRTCIATMYEVADDAAISSVDFNELDSID